MTREHAAVQLLRHGPLNLQEFEQITGWNYRSCCNTLARVYAKGKVKLVRKGGSAKHRSVYEAV